MFCKKNIRFRYSNKYFHLALSCWSSAASHKATRLACRECSLARPQILHGILSLGLGFLEVEMKIYIFCSVFDGVTRFPARPKKYELSGCLVGRVDGKE